MRELKTCSVAFAASCAFSLIVTSFDFTRIAYQRCADLMADAISFVTTTQLNFATNHTLTNSMRNETIITIVENRTLNRAEELGFGFRHILL